MSRVPLVEPETASGSTAGLLAAWLTEACQVDVDWPLVHHTTVLK